MYAIQFLPAQSSAMMSPPWANSDDLVHNNLLERNDSSLELLLMEEIL